MILSMIVELKNFIQLTLDERMTTKLQILKIMRSYFFITLEYMKFKSQFYGLTKKIKNARNNGFIIREIVNLTINVDSSLSITNICYYLKLTVPIMLRELFTKYHENQNIEKLFVLIEIILSTLHVVDGFYKQQSFMLKYYKNSTGQLSYLLFLANRSEHSRQSFPSNLVNFFKVHDIDSSYI